MHLHKYSLLICENCKLIILVKNDLFHEKFGMKKWAQRAKLEFLILEASKFSQLFFSHLDSPDNFSFVFEKPFSLFSTHFAWIKYGWSLCISWRNRTIPSADSCFQKSWLVSRDLCFYFNKRPLYGLWASFLTNWTEVATSSQDSAKKKSVSNQQLKE